MKALYCCLIGLFLFVSSGDNKLEAKSIYSNTGLSFFYSKNCNFEKQKCLFSCAKFYGSESSKNDPEKNKKKNRKGVKPLLFGILSNYNCQIGFASCESILFKQISYCFYTFSGNGKRGPPTPCQPQRV